MSSSVGVPMNGAQRFAHIDAMRAYAVIVVVLAHAGAGAVVPGGSGVTIFFTISGFIITFLLLKERDKTGGFSVTGFYRRRAFKIAPPFFVAIVVPSLVFAALGGRLDWGAFAAQVLFVFNWLKIGAVPDVLPGSGVVWSLSIEEQFYILFALIWLILVRKRHWAGLTIALAVTAIVISTSLRLYFAEIGASGQRIYYGSDTRLDGIAWGMLLAVGYFAWLKAGEPRNRLSRTLSSDLILIGAVLLYVASLLIRDEWFRDTFRFTIQSLAAATVIAYGLLPGSGRIRRAFYAVSLWRPVAIIGLSSYSIYLVHLILDSALRDILAPLPFALSFITLIGVGVGVGIAMYFAIEVPAQRLRVRLEHRTIVRDREPVPRP